MSAFCLVSKGVLELIHRWCSPVKADKLLVRTIKHNYTVTFEHMSLAHLHMIGAQGQFT